MRQRSMSLYVEMLLQFCGACLSVLSGCEMRRTWMLMSAVTMLSFSCGEAQSDIDEDEQCHGG